MAENSNCIENNKFPSTDLLVFSDTIKLSTTIKKRHIRKKHFECEVCKMKFNSRCHRDDHVRTHTGEKPHICVICNRRFNQKSNLKKHFLTHTGERRFNCNICPQKFTYNHHFQLHMLRHAGEKPHECEICKRAFTSKSYLKNHMITHTDLKPYTCKFCEMRFRHRRTRKNHMRIHTGITEFHVCSKCGKSFTSKAVLQKHMNFHNVEKIFAAHYEKQLQIKEKKLILKSKAKSNHKKGYECHECSLNFKYEKEFQQHIGNHELLKSFICYQCDKKFTKSSDLVEHLRSCMGRKKSESSRNVQKQNDELSKPFVCYQCNKGYILAHDLIIHLRSCMINKTYACSTCGTKFANKVIFLLKHNCNIKNSIKSLEDDVRREGISAEKDMNSHLKIDEKLNDKEKPNLKFSGQNSDAILHENSETVELDSC